MSKGGGGDENNVHWFSVKYGVDQTALFNADCWAQPLLDHMKTHCGFGSIPEKVDLQPEGETALVGLDKVGLVSATQKIRPKGIYQLCKLTEEGGHTSLWSAAPKAETTDVTKPDPTPDPTPRDEKGKKKK